MGCVSICSHSPGLSLSCSSYCPLVANLGVTLEGMEGGTGEVVGGCYPVYSE